MVVTDLEAEDDLVVDEVIENINTLKEQLQKELGYMKKAIAENNNAMNEVQTKNEARFTEIKKYVLATIPKIKYMTSLHDKPVYQTLFENIRLSNPDNYADGWFCDGMKMSNLGC